MTKIGLLLPTRESVIYGNQAGDPRPLVELAVRAEQAGFDSVWAGDSLLAKPRPEPITLLAAVASQTSRIELGTAVLLAPMRNAEQLSQATATLDALSGGRFILGVGAGPGAPGVADDFALVGADFSRRSSEMFEVIRRSQALWRGEGQQMYPLPGRPGGPPLWIGGSGPKTLERTGTYADGWFPILASHQGYIDGLAAVHSAAEAAGRDPADITPAIYTTVVIGDKVTAQAALEEHSQLYYGVPHEVIARDQGSVAGTKHEVLDWLGGFVDAGAEHVCIRVGCADIDGQVELLADLLSDLQ